MMEGVSAICSKKNTKHYAAGGIVESGYDNPARPMAGVANLINGFQRGLAGYERENAFREDREYLKQEREHQKLRRERQEQAYEMQMGVRKAAGQFAASGGVDVQPLIDLHNQRNPDSKINLAQDPGGSGNFALITTRPDGTEASKILKPEEIRTFGMNLTQSLHDPNAYFAQQEKLDEKRREFNERMKLLREGQRLRSTRTPAPKPVKYPARGAVLDLQDIIASDPELSKMGEEDRKRMAFNAAARTQKILAENPGIDASEAIAQALEEETLNISPGEQRALFGVDLLAPDKKPGYRDRRTGATNKVSPPVTRITGDEDFHSLPSGTRFIGPDGVRRVKP